MDLWRRRVQEGLREGFIVFSFGRECLIQVLEGVEILRALVEAEVCRSCTGMFGKLSWLRNAPSVT